MKKFILALLVVSILVGCPGVVALAETSAPQTQTTVEPIGPDEATQRINSAVMRVYLAGVETMPTLATFAILCGCLLLLVSSAFGLEKIRNASIIGIGIIVLAVVIAYAAPFIAGAAKGIGINL